MSFISRYADGEELAIPMDETLRDLRRTLPKDHPTLEDVSNCFEWCRDVIESHMKKADEKGTEEEISITELVQAVLDWGRGMADGDDVLRIARSLRETEICQAEFVT